MKKKIIFGVKDVFISEMRGIKIIAEESLLS